MKVIDLLNKIANNEEVPKKIKYDTIYYYFRNYDYKEYEMFEDYIDKQSSFIEKIDFYKLNDEIEIIEEKPKKIEKLPKHITDNACASKDLREIANKVNELIDYLLEKESDK